VESWEPGLPDQLISRNRGDRSTLDRMRASGNPRQSDEGQECQRREDERLRGSDPEPSVGARFPDQTPLRIIRPYQAEEDQKTNAVYYSARENRLRELGHRSEHHVREKVPQHDGPQEGCVAKNMRGMLEA
jgi:hypothetical protein